jgi:hypothetical protein
MIELSGEIAKYNEKILHHNDSLDKRNYNFEKCSLITVKVSILQEEFYKLKNKWF